jgi:flagellar basal body-associated protein FliL
MIDFKCSCGKALRVPDGLARKIVTCNQCGRKDIQLPGAGEKLDLSDYELEDAGGTIVLEPPASNSFRPRKAISQPRKAEIPGKKSRRQLRREASVEPEPEPEFEDAPARPSKNTKRLESRKQQEEVAPAPTKRPSRRGSQKRQEPVQEPEPVEDDVEEEVQKEVTPVRSREKSSLKARSSQIELKRSSSVKKNVADDADTVEGVQAPRRGSGRAERNNRRGSEVRSRRSRDTSSGDDDIAIDNGNSQKFIIIILVAIVILGGGLFFYFFKNSEKKATNTQTSTVATDEKKPKKPENTPKPVEEPKYENITEVGKELLVRFGIKGSNRDAIEVALEEKRKKAVEKKLSTKSYDSYIKEVLGKKLAFVFAIENAIENANLDSEDYKFLLYTIQSRINASTIISDDEALIKDFPLDLKAEKIEWNKETLVPYLDKVKKEFEDEFSNVPIIKSKIDWKLIVEIVKDGKVENDTFNGPALDPQ